MRSWTWVVVMALFFTFACAHNKEVTMETVGEEGPSLVMEKQGKDEKVEKADLDGDGKPDVFTYYKLDPIKKKFYKVRVEADLSGDGKLDLWRRFDKLGRRVEDRYDLDFDGKVDEIVKYKNGRKSVVMLSTHFDGKFDVKEFYAMMTDPQTQQKKLELVLIKRSSKRNGIYDEFHYFVNGRLIRIGWDRDGDGRPEVFEDNPTVAGD